MAAMLSLYRRHRPRTFEEVVGQEHIVRTLRNAIALGKVHHANLFVGSRGTGKTSMAKLLACALNADGGPRTDFSPDDPACVAIRNGSSLDVVEMDAASNNSVDDIRELRENVALTPMGSARRVYILDEAHMLSTAAWNAFLKTLEEPPAHVVFVLATTEAHKVPETIVDRCHRFDFHRPSLEQIAGVLRRVAVEEGIEIPDAAVGMIARSATGSFRDALGTLEQLVTYGGREVRTDDVLEVLGVADAALVLDAADAVADHDAKAALLAVERLAGSGRDVTQFMRDLIAHLRHLFVVQTLGHVPDSFAVTAEHTDRLSGQAARLAQGEVLRSIDLLGAGVAAVRDGSEPRIQLELALLKAAQPEADRSLSALMFRIERLEQRLAGGGGAPPATPAASDDASGEAGQPPAAPREQAAAAARTPAAVPARTEGNPGRPAVGAPLAPAVAAAAPAEAPAPPEETVAPEVTDLDLDRVRTLWPAALEEVARENAMVAALLGEARPTALDGGRLTVTFPPDHAFSRKKAESNRALLQAALHGLTGRGVFVVCELGDGPVEDGATGLSEEELLARLKEEFDARELLDDEQPSPRS
jgi:DNA polymerase-3 subunit gamma/tau